MYALREWLFASPKERHRPPHRPGSGLATFVTASTLRREPHLGTAARRSRFRELLLETCEATQTELIAWVVLREHYHAIIVPESGEAFSTWINALHRRSASEWNREDQRRGRRCWYEYWDRALWTEGDLLSRLNYIHENPVKHGYVQETADWEWSSLPEWLALDSYEEMLAKFPAPKRLPNDDF
jgi:putative transposase